MKKRNIVLVALAVVLVLNAGIGSAWAYFTTYTEAKGGYAIELGTETRMEEEFSAWTKHVTVRNANGSQPVFVRVKAFCGSQYELLYSDESGLWYPGGDGYYYYGAVLDGGKTTDELQIKIANVPADAKDADSFNVVVIYESTPVQYSADGNPRPNWNIKLGSGHVEGGGN